MLIAIGVLLSVSAQAAPLSPAFVRPSRPSNLPARWKKFIGAAAAVGEAGVAAATGVPTVIGIPATVLADTTAGGVEFAGGRIVQTGAAAGAGSIKYSR